VKDQTTPWLPAARLHRQPTPGDWASVVDQLVAEMKTAS
jgi:hypothetical protein